MANQSKFVFLLLLGTIFCARIGFTDKIHTHTFPDGKHYYVKLALSSPNEVTGTSGGKITINSVDDNRVLGYADFELGYINPMFDVLSKGDRDSLKTLYVSMVNTQNAPPNSGKLLVAYLSKLADSLGYPIALAAAWGAGLFWAKMGFIFTTPRELISTGVFKHGPSKPAQQKLSIKHFLKELEYVLAGGLPSYLDKRLVMPKSMVKQWSGISNEDLENLRFPTLDYQKLYTEFDADPEQAKRVAEQLKAYKKR